MVRFLIDFSYIILSTPSAPNDVDYVFTVQDMSVLTVKFTPLKENVDPSLICLNSPHLASLHFVTSNFICCLLEKMLNLAISSGLVVNVYFLKYSLCL